MAMMTVKTKYIKKYNKTDWYAIAKIEIEPISFKRTIRVEDDVQWLQIVDHFENLREWVEDERADDFETIEEVMIELAKWRRNDDLRDIALDLIPLIMDNYF